MFIDELNLPEQDRQKLSRLQARSALDLLFRRKAAPEDFARYVGPDRDQAIELELLSKLTVEERRKLDTPPPPRHRMGARIGSLSPPK